MERFLGFRRIPSIIAASARLHDLRHSFASFAASAGMSLPMIGKLLGHKSVQTTARYTHLHDEYIRAATNQIGAVIGGAVKGYVREG